MASKTIRHNKTSLQNQSRFPVCQVANDAGLTERGSQVGYVGEVAFVRGREAGGEMPKPAAGKSCLGGKGIICWVWITC